MPISYPQARHGLMALLCWAVSATAGAADCKLTLNDDTVDYGRLFGARIGQAADTARTPIASANRALSAVCSGPTVIAVKLDGTDSGDGSIKLGNIADYTLTVTQVLLDGQAVQLGMSKAGSPAAAVPMPAQIHQGDTIVPIDANAPATGSRLDVSLRVDAFRARQTGLNQETTVNAQSRFFVVTQ